MRTPEELISTIAEDSTIDPLGKDERFDPRDPTLPRSSSTILNAMGEISQMTATNVHEL